VRAEPEQEPTKTGKRGVASLPMGIKFGLLDSIRTSITSTSQPSSSLL